MKQEFKRKQAQRSIRLLFVESALTRAAFVMPVVYLLWTNYLGMDQFKIGLLQAVFAGTMLLLQFPTGYFADRISHKLSNSIGDIMLILGMLVYFISGNFWHAVIAEILLGTGYSFSGGADSALLKEHARVAGVDYKMLNARLASAGFVIAALTSIAGGFIGSENVRYAFAVEGVVMGVALVLSLLIKDSGVRHKTKDRMFRGMIKVAKQLSYEPVLLRRMLLGAALFSSTMLLVWFLTPMFFEVGLDLKWHGFLHASVSLFAILGSEFASTKLGRRWKLGFPLLIVALVYLILGTYLSIWTFLIFLLSSFMRGVNTAKVAPAVQEVAPRGLEASALSLMNVFFRVFTVVTMVVVNWFGNISIQLGLFVAGAIVLFSWIFFRSWSE